ncbi:MAG: hypothetical protein AAF146_21555, partial [Bacteroidota bacterium]
GLLAEELERQRHGVELIASENFASAGNQRVFNHDGFFYSKIRELQNYDISTNKMAFFAYNRFIEARTYQMPSN